MSIVPTNQKYYYSLMMKNIQELKSKYNFLEVGNIGFSTLGKQLPYIKIGRGSRKIMYNAGMHANEYICCILLMKFVENFCQSYVLNSRIFGQNARKLFNNVSLYILPMMNPDIVTAIGFMLLFTSLSIEKGFGTILLAHIVFCIPYVILTVMPRLRQLDDNLAEAALDLGATPFQALTKVIIPQLKSSIVAGALIAFTMSFDDFVISFFTSGPAVNTVAIYVYSSIKRINPTINALSTIIVLIVTIVLVLMNVVPMIKNRKKEEGYEK